MAAQKAMGEPLSHERHVNAAPLNAREAVLPLLGCVTVVKPLALFPSSVKCGDPFAASPGTIGSAGACFAALYGCQLILYRSW